MDHNGKTGRRGEGGTEGRKEKLKIWDNKKV